MDRDAAGRQLSRCVEELTFTTQVRGRRVESELDLREPCSRRSFQSGGAEVGLGVSTYAIPAAHHSACHSAVRFPTNRRQSAPTHVPNCVSAIVRVRASSLVKFTQMEEAGRQIYSVARELVHQLEV